MAIYGEATCTAFSVIPLLTSHNNNTDKYTFWTTRGLAKFENATHQQLYWLAQKGATKAKFLASNAHENCRSGRGKPAHILHGTYARPQPIRRVHSGARNVRSSCHGILIASHILNSFPIRKALWAADALSCPPQQP